MTTEKNTTAPVRQLRLIVEVNNYEAAVTFYRDVLGLTEQAASEGDGAARVTILDAGRATLELSNPAQTRMIDDIEADGSPSAKIRVAFEVDDSATATKDLIAAGATLIAEPRQTPWKSLNARLTGPDGLQVTLFQELEDIQTRSTSPGFKRP